MLGSSSAIRILFPITPPASHRSRSPPTRPLRATVDRIAATAPAAALPGETLPSASAGRSRAAHRDRCGSGWPRTRARPAGAGATTAGNGTPRPRIDVPLLDVQTRAGEPKPRRGPGFRNALRQREDPSAIDEQARAARLEIDRALDLRVVVDGKRSKQPERRLDLQGVLHHEAQEQRARFRVAQQPVAQPVAERRDRRRATGNRT